MLCIYFKTGKKIRVSRFYQNGVRNQHIVQSGVVTALAEQTIANNSNNSEKKIHMV